MGLRSRLAVFPPALQFAEQVESALHWLAWRARRRPVPHGPSLRLHLGCGDIDHPGFINVDARPRPHVHFVQRFDRLQRFPDNSVSLIYTAHGLEHVPHRETVNVLREWCRVLQPGGVVRISVPDFDLLVDAYLDSGRDMACILLPLMGAQDYAFNFHYVAFTRASLEAVLREAGFSVVRHWTHGSEPDTSLPDWSGREFVFGGKSYPVSLNLEAVK